MIQTNGLSSTVRHNLNENGIYCERRVKPLAASGRTGPQDGKPAACSRKVCVSRARQNYKKRNNVEDISTLWSFSLTDDDHLLHKAFTGVAWRPTYFLQRGMSDFLSWNPPQSNYWLRESKQDGRHHCFEPRAIPYSPPTATVSGASPGRRRAIQRAHGGGGALGRWVGEVA